MTYQHFKLFFRVLSFFLPVLISFSSCGKKDEPEPIGNETKTDMTVLVYAVASNNLWNDFQSDCREMLQGLEKVDLKCNRLLIYEVSPLTSSLSPNLYEAIRDNQGKLTLKEVKEYSRDIYSTDPRRLSGVIQDVCKLAPAEKYGLVLWSHGAGWLPSKSKVRPHGVFYSFGYDEGQKGVDHMDIDELAAAIPDGLFHFIWFDACYMSGIETVYQLRDKCNFMVAYPTEIWAEGMPYQLVMPLLMRAAPALKEAAQSVFGYFAKSNRPATICMVDMSHIEEVAEATKAIYDLLPENAYIDPYNSGWQIYSRNPNGDLDYPFYDFGQITRGWFEESEAITLPEELLTSFEESMCKLVVCKDISERDFNFGYFDPTVYSGLSTHIWRGDGTWSEEYYTTLDWYRRIHGLPMGGR